MFRPSKNKQRQRKKEHGFRKRMATPTAAERRAESSSPTELLRVSRQTS